MKKQRVVQLKEQMPAGWGLKQLRILIISISILFLMACITLVVVPAAFPAVGAGTADFLRSIFGPEPVARLESLSFWLSDNINRIRFAGDDAEPQINWYGKTQATAENLIAAASPEPQLIKTDQPYPVGTQSPIMPVLEITPTPPARNVVTELPLIGWQAFGPTAQDGPLLARTIVMVDPARPYVSVALVRLDLARLALHIMPGNIEPAHPSGIHKVITNIGFIPPEDQEKLVAAFNGGFQGVHGHYGMMVNGYTILKPLENMATVALYQDDSVRIGTWGSDISLTPDIAAFRQNCPPLILAGQANPALSTNANKKWGYTNNADITWRTGLGITQDGRYLIYAVGNGADAKFLAEALQDAGAYMAMQLDINQYYARFVTYTKGDDPAAPEAGQWMAKRLLDQMDNDPDIYLTPYPRDFFYLTLR